jgi:hypothetical protein
MHCSLPVQMFNVMYHVQDQGSILDVVPLCVVHVEILEGRVLSA